MSTDRLKSLRAPLFFLAIVGLCFAGRVSAQTPPACLKIADNKAHVCWTAPETNIDGSPTVLALTYDVELQSGTTWTKVATGISAKDYTSPALTPGTYTYRVIAFAGGKSSAPSSSASKLTDNPTPNAPSVIIVAATIKAGHAPTYRIVYTVKPKDGEIVFVAPETLRTLFASTAK